MPISRAAMRVFRRTAVMMGPARAGAGRAVPLVLALFALASLSGCQERQGPGNPAKNFIATGEERVRELGIYSGAERVGDLRISRLRGTWQGQEEALQMAEDVHLRLSFRKDRFEVTSRQISWVGRENDLKASLSSMDFGAGQWETTVTKVGEKVYEREQVTAGSRSRDRIEVPDGALLSEVLPLFLGSSRMGEGERAKLTLFSMALDQALPLTLEFAGLTPEGRLYELTYWGMEEKLWIDDTGLPVREEMALGVSAREPRRGERVAHLALERILSGTSVPGVGIPEDMGQRAKAAVVLEGSVRPPPGGTWQQVEAEGDTARVVLTRPVIPPADLRLADAGLMPHDTFGLDLDSPRIKSLAGKITGSISDPWEKTLAIGNWVYREVGKSMRECFSAVQVLETGEGECQSHSLLTVSLARAAGLPARFAYGVVYMPDRKAYGFHTWVEVHVGEWIPVDPTLGNFPAGADHLTLAVGGYQDQFRLFPYIMGRGGWRIKFDDLRSDGKGH